MTGFVRVGCNQLSKFTVLSVFLKERRTSQSPKAGHKGPVGRIFEISDSNPIRGKCRRLGQKSCRTKVSRIFRIFVPNFAPNFAPNFPEFFEDFSCLVSWETETRKNSPKIPAIFQGKIPRQTRKKYSQNSSGDQAK